ncbi:MAG TPA: hypothetical protein VLA34_15560, partial [Candidatus Krumholzibacterium sp.]|nr:hypothetical protein [Candidatus Krumholzibacterium sp.]
PDSGSTFEIDMLYGVFPLDTVDVAVYFNSDSTAGYIQHRIRWDDSALTLLEVVLGPGVPGTATLMCQAGVDTVQYTINDSAEFQVPDGQPVAYLRFEVQCYGYGARTNIEFIGGSDINYYNHNNISYAPLRIDGFIRTQYDGNYNSFAYPEYVTAYPGQQVVPMDFVFAQDAPGQLIEARLVYDTTVVRCDSIVPGPGLNGGVLNVSTSYDTIILEMPETNPLMDVDIQVTPFTLYFSMETGDDDFTTYVGLPVVKRLNECGNITIPYHNGNWIEVEDHVAEADLGEVSYYTTATTYDVPVVMDSNVPINDYELYVQYPMDDLSFVEVVAVAGFAAPGWNYEASDSSVIQLNSSLFTDYDPDDLPTTVFKLRFEKTHSTAVGDTMFVTFYETSQNEVRYDMDDPFGFHTADLTLEDGYIRIKSRPIITCPALYIWDGDSFELENTILAACDGADVTEDVTEYYKIRKNVVPEDGKLSFRIVEDGAQISTFKDF